MGQGRDMRYLDIPTRDAAYNLALEEILFTRMPKSHPGYFLLWQNRPSIIIGRYQMTAEVINQAFASEMALL